MHKLKQVIKIFIGIILYVVAMDVILKTLFYDVFDSSKIYKILIFLVTFILFFVLKVRTFFICLGMAAVLCMSAFLKDSSERYLPTSAFGFLAGSLGLCIVIFLFHLFLLLLMKFLKLIRLHKVFPIITRWNKIISDVWKESEKQAESTNLYVNGLKKAWVVFLFMAEMPRANNPMGFFLLLCVSLFNKLKKYLEPNKDKN